MYLFDNLRQGNELVVNKMESAEIRRAEKDDRMREEMKELYRDQMNTSLNQINYERQKMALEVKEMRKTMREQQKKFDARELELKAEIRSIKFKSISSFVIVAGASFFFGMSINYFTLLIIIVLMMGFIFLMMPSLLSPFKSIFN